MGFGGSASAMVHSIKMNLAQRRAKKSKKGIDSAKREKTEYNFGKVSDEELEIIKQNIRLKIRSEKQIRAVIVIILTLIIILSIIYIF